MGHSGSQTQRMRGMGKELHDCDSAAELVSTLQQFHLQPTAAERPMTDFRQGLWADPPPHVRPGRLLLNTERAQQQPAASALLGRDLQSTEGRK